MIHTRASLFVFLLKLALHIRAHISATVQRRVAGDAWRGGPRGPGVGMGVAELAVTVTGRPDLLLALDMDLDAATQPDPVAALP